MRKPDRHAFALLLLFMAARTLASAEAVARGSIHHSGHSGGRGSEAARGELISTATPSVRIDADGEVISMPTPPTTNDSGGGPSRTGSRAGPDDAVSPTEERRLQR